MTTEEVYIENICKYCKGNCNKGIVVFNNDSTIYTKCMDYEPKNTIKKNKKILTFWQGW